MRQRRARRRKPLCSGGKCTTVSGGGTVRYTNGTIVPITFVPKCGNGTNTNCTEPVAETSCTASVASS